MSADAALSFIDLVMQHYPPFRWDEEQEKAWATTMVREIGGFSDEVITKAIETMVRTRKERRTPLVSECIEACLDARKWIEGEKRSASLPFEGHTTANLDWTGDRLKLASELVTSAMGKQASKEGWVGALWSFARRNSRLPQPGKEVDECKKTAKEFDEAYAICVRNPHNPLTAALERLGAEMIKRRKLTEDRVLGRR